MVGVLRQQAAMNSSQITKSFRETRSEKGMKGVTKYIRGKKKSNKKRIKIKKKQEKKQRKKKVEKKGRDKDRQKETEKKLLNECRQGEKSV